MSDDLWCEIEFPFAFCITPILLDDSFARAAKKNMKIHSTIHYSNYLWQIDTDAEVYTNSEKAHPKIDCTSIKFVSAINMCFACLYIAI